MNSSQGLLWHRHGKGGVDRHGRWTRPEPDMVVLGDPGRHGRGRAWSRAEPVCLRLLATSPMCPRMTGVLNAFALPSWEGEGGCQKRTHFYGGEGIPRSRQISYRSLTELGRSPYLLTPLPRRFPNILHPSAALASPSRPAWTEERGPFVPILPPRPHPPSREAPQANAPSLSC